MDWTPEEIRKIKFKAYHYYLSRIRTGKISDIEEKRKILEIGDWRNAEFDLLKEEYESSSMGDKS